MRNLAIKDVALAAEGIGLDADTRRDLMNELHAILKGQGSLSEEEPGQYVFVLADHEGHLLEEYETLVGWVVKIAQDESPLSVGSLIYEAAHDYNRLPEGELCPVQTVGETFECLPVELLREHGLYLETMEPVYAVPVGNEIADTPGLFSEEAFRNDDDFDEAFQEGDEAGEEEE